MIPHKIDSWMVVIHIFWHSRSPYTSRRINLHQTHLNDVLFFLDCIINLWNILLPRWYSKTDQSNKIAPKYVLLLVKETLSLSQYFYHFISISSLAPATIQLYFLFVLISWFDSVATAFHVHIAKLCYWAHSLRHVPGALFSKSKTTYLLMI